MTAELIDVETGEITYEVHPVADLFPYIDGDQFQEFVEDIKINGQREPVVLDMDGRLLDGRNRVRACRQLGLAVKETRYSGDDAESWIISHNVHRRHLTESQRAMIAARLATLQRGEFHGNQYRSGDRQLADTTLDEPEGQPVTRSAAATKDAAAALSVGTRTVERARKVINSGDTELIKQVESGEVSVGRAERQIDQRHDEAPENETAKPMRPPSPPKFGPRKRHAQVIESMAVGLSGYATAADEIAESGFDKTITTEEAARLADDLSNSLRSLNRIKTLLYKETTK